MKKILLLIPILFIVSCSSNISSNNDKQFYLIRVADRDFEIKCDIKTGIEYLIYINGHKAGLTVYLDENGNPARCVKKEEK